MYADFSLPYLLLTAAVPPLATAAPTARRTPLTLTSLSTSFSPPLASGWCTLRSQAYNGCFNMDVEAQFNMLKKYLSSRKTTGMGMGYLDIAKQSCAQAALEMGVGSQ